MSTVIGTRRTVKDAALAALAARPGRRAKERNWELEQAQREVSQLTEAVKSQAIELALSRPAQRGRSRRGRRTVRARRGRLGGMRISTSGHVS